MRLFIKLKVSEIIKIAMQKFYLTRILIKSKSRNSTLQAQLKMIAKINVRSSASQFFFIQL